MHGDHKLTVYIRRGQGIRLRTYEDAHTYAYGTEKMLRNNSLLSGLRRKHEEVTAEEGVCLTVFPGAGMRGAECGVGRVGNQSADAMSFDKEISSNWENGQKANGSRN